MTLCSVRNFKGELNPKIDFSSFEHLGIVEQLYKVYWLLDKQFKKKKKCFVMNRKNLIGSSICGVGGCL